MLFELKTETECELTSFTGRTQKSDGDDVPAVTFRLKMASARNTLLDQFSSTFRHTAYMAVEGQEQLLGVEPSTPVLRSKDLKHWSCETVHEGWTVTVARGISDGGALRMGSCKIDCFNFDLYEGGHVDLEFRVSTADVDEDGAGMLWGRQRRKVFVRIEAPEIPKPAIDGSVKAFKKDHPDADDGQGSLLDPEIALAGAVGSDPGEGDPDKHDGDDGSGHPDAEQPAEPQRGTNWPFPGTKAASGETDDAAREQAELEAGMAQSIAAAGVSPKGRRGRKTAAVE